MSTVDDQSAVTRNVEVAREYFAAVDAKDLDRALACWTPSGGIESVPGARDLTVPDGMREFFTEVFRAFGEWSIEVLHLTASEDHVVVHWRISARFTGPGTFSGFRPTGASGRFEGLDQLTFRDGLIVRNDAHFDSMEMARAIGVMPPPGGRQEKAMTALVNLQTTLKARLGR